MAARMEDEPTTQQLLGGLPARVGGHSTIGLLGRVAPDLSAQPHRIAMGCAAGLHRRRHHDGNRLSLSAFALPWPDSVTAIELSAQSAKPAQHLPAAGSLFSPPAIRASATVSWPKPGWPQDSGAGAPSTSARRHGGASGTGHGILACAALNIGSTPVKQFMVPVSQRRSRVLRISRRSEKNVA